MFTLPGEDLAEPEWDDVTSSVRPSPTVKCRQAGDKYFILDAAGEPIDSTAHQSRVPALIEHWQQILYPEEEPVPSTKRYT